MLLTTILYALLVGITAEFSPDTTKVLPSVEVQSAAHRQEVTAAVQVQTVNSDEWHALGISGVSEALRRFAGTEVKDYGGIGGMKTVSIHNLGAAHTAVSYDGVCVSQVLSGQTDIGRFATDNLGMIAMAVGQQEDMLQTARHYAAAGVVALTTSYDEGLRLTLRAGSFGLVAPTLTFGHTGKRLSAGGHLSYMRADGEYPFTLTNGKLVTEERRLNSDIWSICGEGNIGYAFADGAMLRSKVYYYHSERGLPGGVVLYNSDARERLRDDNLMWQTSYQRRPGERWQMRTHAKYTHGYDHYSDTDVKYAGGHYVETTKQDEYYGSATFAYQPLGWLRMALANDVAYNHLNTSVYEGLNPSRLTWLMALSARATVGRLTANGTVSSTVAAEHWSADYQNTTGEAMPEDKRRVTPSIALAYRLLPSEAAYLRLMYKETFRLPTFNDLYYRQMGTLTLRPEKAHEWSMGLTWSRRPKGIVRALAITADAYMNNVDDKIVAFPTTYVWRMANFGKVLIRGIDVSAQTSIDIRKGKSKEEDIYVDLRGAWTLNDARDRTDRQTAYYDLQLPYTPRQSGSISAVIHTPWITLGYMALFCGERFSGMVHDDIYRLKPYCDQSITLTRDFVLGSSIITVQGKINNIADCQYEIVKFYPMPGRNFEVSASWKFDGKKVGKIGRRL